LAYYFSIFLTLTNLKALFLIEYFLRISKDTLFLSIVGISILGILGFANNIKTALSQAVLKCKWLFAYRQLPVSASSH